MSAFLRTPVLALAACFVAACSASEGDPADDAQEAIGTSQAKIISGKSSPAAQDATVLLIYAQSNGDFAACTGTMLAPNLVLTARHCVSQTTDKPFYCDADGKLYSAEPGGGTISVDYAPSDIFVFTGPKRPNFNLGKVSAAARGKTIVHDNANVICGHDLALLILDKTVDNIPIASVRLDAETQVGETMTAVGWGVTTTTQIPSVRQQRTGIVIQHVGPFGGNGERAVPPNDFSVGESICSGDSGGPAFSESTGAVIGVVSRGGNGNLDPDDPAAGCVGAQTVNNYARAAPFKDLILSAFTAAGYEPWLEGGPDPRLSKFGVECSTNEECQSSICANNACSQSCAAGAAPCPEGYVCKTGGGESVCRKRENAATSSGASCAMGQPGAGSPFGGLMIAALVGLAITARKRR